MKTDWTKHWDMSRNNSWNIWRWRIAHAYRKLLRDVKIENAKILELGSGSGRNSLNMAKIFDIKKITLVDSNKRAIEMSKKLFKNSNLKVNYITKDVFKLNLKERFDMVHSEGLIEHFYVKKQLEVLKRHADFCKRGGFIVIFVPYDGIPYKVFRAIYKSFNSWIWDEKPLTKGQLKILCNKADLQILKQYYSPLTHEIGMLLKKN